MPSSCDFRPPNVGFGALVEGLDALGYRAGVNVEIHCRSALDYAAKALQLLKEAAPRIKRVGVFGSSTTPSFPIYQSELGSAAAAIGLELDFAGVESDAQIEGAIARLATRGIDAFVVLHQPFTFDRNNRARIIDAVSRQGLPAIFGSREAVAIPVALRVRADHVYE